MTASRYVVSETEFQKVKKALSDYEIMNARNFLRVEATQMVRAYPFIFTYVKEEPRDEPAPGLVYVDGKWRLHPKESFAATNQSLLPAHDNWQTAVAAFKLLWTPT